MRRNTLGALGGLALALSLTGMALASNLGAEAGGSAELSGEGRTDIAVASGDQLDGDVSVEGSTDVSTGADATADTAGTSATIESGAEAEAEARSSSSATIDNDSDGTTSTTADDDTTSTTADNGDEADLVVDLGRQTFQINGVGTVTVDVTGGEIELVSVDAPGWDVEIHEATSKEVRIRFVNGSAKAEFEAEVKAGLDVEIETKS